MKVSLDDRICVVGAGPAGITTAYELSRQGFTDVVVVEKAGRVGGLCLSVGYDGHAFDLGANYVTSAYRQIRKLARELGAPMYTETRAVFFDPTWPGRFRSIFSQARGDAGLLAFTWACLRYLVLRWRLGKTLPDVGYRGVSNNPALMRSFDQWLLDNRLESLRTLCAIPVTLMGYGRLSEVPAPYVLTYLNVRTFLDLMIYGSGLPRRWPKRFVDGFQRLFERMSWHLDVRLDTRITQVIRTDSGVAVLLDSPVGEGWQAERVVVEETFRWIVLCCPLQEAPTFLDTTETEARLIDRIALNPFATSTYEINPGPDLPARLVNVTASIDSDPGEDDAPVSIVTQQFEGVPLVTFYTPLPARLASAAPTRDEDGDDDVLEGVRALAGQLGLSLKDPDEPFSTDQWPYFPHVGVEDFEDGWYDELEGLQGTRSTFYNGGVMCFELIEPIVEYSQALVRAHFVAGLS